MEENRRAAGTSFRIDRGWWLRGTGESGALLSHAGRHACALGQICLAMDMEREDIAGRIDLYEVAREGVILDERLERLIDACNPLPDVHNPVTGKLAHPLTAFCGVNDARGWNDAKRETVLAQLGRKLRLELRFVGRALPTYSRGYWENVAEAAGPEADPEGPLMLKVHEQHMDGEGQWVPTREPWRIDAETAARARRQCGRYLVAATRDTPEATVRIRAAMADRRVVYDRYTEEPRPR